MPPARLLSARVHASRPNFFAQGGPLLSRKIYGASGQSALQLGAAVGIFLAFVALPSLASYARLQQKRKHGESAASRGRLQESVAERQTQLAAVRRDTPKPAPAWFTSFARSR